MTRKLTVKVITGSIGRQALISLWESLTDKFDIELMVLEDESLKRDVSFIPMVLFPKIAEMPGFYRDLDRYLKSADLVISVGTAQLFTFQALRVSKSLGIPCIVLSHDFTPFIYEQFANVKAIQFDIYKNSECFLATTQRAEELLLNEGVAKSRIRSLPVSFSEINAKFSQATRDKFRNYIGVKGRELLCVVKSDFSIKSNVSAILQSLNLTVARLNQEAVESLKVLFVGVGDQIEKYKYQASDLGLAKKVIFLNQDSSPFWLDICQAADLCLWDRVNLSDVSEEFPFSLLESEATGALNIVPTGTIYDEVSSSKYTTRIPEFSAMPLASSLVQAIERLSSGKVEERSKRSFIEIEKQSSSKQQASEVCVEVFESIATGKTLSDRCEKAWQFVKHNHDPINSSKARDVLLSTEEFLLLKDIDLELKAELLRLKGDALSAVFQSEEAIACYESALVSDKECYRANRGLGYVAWTGHSHEEAAVFFKRCLSVEPNEYHALLGMGLIYRRLKMLDEAIFWLGRALEVRGAGSSAFNLIIQACVESPEAKSALVCLEELRETYGDSPNILRGLNHVYLAQGKSENLSKLLEQMSA